MSLNPTGTPPTNAFCPYLGLAGDRTVTRTVPDTGHRCYARTPPGSPDEAHQNAFCLSSAYGACPFFRAPEARSQAADTRAPAGRRVPWVTLALIAVPLILLAIVAVVYGRDFLSPPAAGQAPAAEGAASPSNLVALPETESGIRTTATPVPAITAVQSQGAVSQSATPDEKDVSELPPAAPTPVAGGRVFTIAPRAGAAGWWTSDKTRGNLGDSYLYAGRYADQVFASAMQLDLQQVPRGAPIEEARLYLTGLAADRFKPAAGGTWLVQLLSSDAIPDLARADFQEVFNAPAAVTLFPGLYPADLATGQVNTLSLDQAGRKWLEEQIAEGRTDLIVRITGPVGGNDTLFAWDSGAGPATAGEPPRLLLSVGAPPATPPPLPTEAVIVATLTPTPANVLTAAADAFNATSAARTTGTATSLPYRIVTPTPLPANLATAQALGQAESFVPMVVYTPTPGNPATATANALYATAVAVTTGTFTPVPDNAVTPVIVLPTPFPENVGAAAAQLLTATAQAARIGTRTPVPTGALIATATATRPIVWPTETPANYATSAARAVYATAVALTTGTFTPIPRDAVTPTREPRATPVPLLVPVTPRPGPSPTSTAPAALPAALKGKILFFSDRDGSEQLYALDPATGRLMWVTQQWPLTLAQAREGRSSDGRFTAEVQTVTDVTAWDRHGNPAATVDTAVIFIRSNEYQTARELTTHDRFSYDPAWSPAADEIAFAARGENDEIWLINADGSNLRRLTTNSWEWDKHPSWSPDGKQIVFWSNRESGRRQLWIMNADGSNQRPLLASSYNDWDPVWVK
jgi:hypothetical protein